MAILKATSESLDLTDDYTFTGKLSGHNYPAFLAYRDTFQNVFRSEINRRFDNVINSSNEQSDQEPWFTDYVTLKPLNHEESKISGNSIVAKAQKITKKACVLLQSSHSENNASNNLEETLTG